jgi:hypothetical protein
MPNRLAHYTVLFGGYETLVEVQKVDPSVDYFCFTDDPNLTSDTWQIVLVERTMPEDAIRSQRMLKILGHPVLKDYDFWLYTDNCFQLKTRSSDFATLLLGDGADVGMIDHSYRDTVQDEYVVVIASGKDNPGLLYRQAADYEMHCPQVFEQKPIWAAAFVRKNSAEVGAWAEAWWGEIKRHSRRDQLSLHAALSQVPLKLNRVALDNFGSEWHEWLVRGLSRKTPDELWLWRPKPNTPKVAEIRRGVKAFPLPKRPRFRTWAGKVKRISIRRLRKLARQSA